MASSKYDFRKIEKKWQNAWERAGIYKAKGKGKKWYSLIEFPYPSGDGLHVGHVRSNTAMDIISRKRRMEGYDVLYPIGWDAFGLPTENYAIKTGVDPAAATKKNTDTFRRQLKALGFSFDWSREVDTTDPEYYKWTQWMFLQFFKRGLAYKAEVPINWCPKDKIGLANEEAAGGVCDRCGGPVTKRTKSQWMIKITAYADKLLEGLKEVDYIPQAKTQQENWIGRSEGAQIRFEVIAPTPQGGRSPDQSVGSDRLEGKHFVEVFTTRPDTLFGATYMVLAPEHPIIANSKGQIANWKEVEDYVKKAAKKSDEDRIAENKDKTGVELKGIKAVNPANGEEIPVWVADYVLGGYGTGAIMAVPAHDERDFEFAKKFKLPIRMVVCPHYPAATCPVLDAAYEGKGRLVDSGRFDGMDSERAKWEITDFVGGKKKVQHKLRDWVFSRQRYWGEPIPLVFCPACKKREETSHLNAGWVPVPDKDLPLKLPKVKKYQPRDDGESPLASVTKWVNTKCPQCKGPAKRETDTMPNWAGSSWYFLRYCDPKNKKSFADPKKLKYWMQVDWYNGGMEHTVLHLLYSRFWNRFLYDIGAVPVAEPYKKRTSQGLILAGGGEKMSKSKGNVLNPDDIVAKFGADSLRLYEMFMGPFDQAIAWDMRGILGVHRFLERVWKMGQIANGTRPNDRSHSVGREWQMAQSREASLRAIHRAIKKVSADIETMSFNTAISALMICANELENAPLGKTDFGEFLKILSPFAPHIAQELWARLGKKTFLDKEPWPAFDPELVKDATFKLVIQVNGRVRDSVEAPAEISEQDALALALGREKVKAFTGGAKPKKVVFVPGRLVSIVV